MAAHATPRACGHTHTQGHSTSHTTTRSMQCGARGNGSRRASPRGAGAGCNDFEVGFAAGVSARDLRTRDGLIRAFVETGLLDPSALQPTPMSKLAGTQYDAPMGDMQPADQLWLAGRNLSKVQVMRLRATQDAQNSSRQDLDSGTSLANEGPPL